ncbi:MAG: type 1 glutamine amidotransferase [Dermatophilaceae bacterium]
MSPRLLVVQHEPDAPLAWLGEWWAEAGVRLDVIRGDLGEQLPGRLDHDGLVVLGGAMGAGDDAEHPWLAPTKALMRDAVKRHVPLLGVCLGHQMLAVALGGRVGRNPDGRTVGLVPVRLTGAGATDPLLAGVSGLRAIHDNSDVVLDLPRGAEVIATLPNGRPQAARFGARAWGVQFHPEASPAVFASWVDADPPVVLGRRGGGTRAEREIAGRALVAGVETVRDHLWEAWRPLANRFVDVVTSSAGEVQHGRGSVST